MNESSPARPAPPEVEPTPGTPDFPVAGLGACAGATTPGQLPGPLAEPGAPPPVLLDAGNADPAAAQREADLRRTRQDELVAMLSHELKNPLNLILLSAELLLRIPAVQGSPPVVRAANTIRRAVASQARLIDDLLDLYRIDTGRLSLERAQVDASAVVRGAVDAVRAEADERGIALEVALPPQPLALEADPARLARIVATLLGHALESSPRGGRVDVRLSLAGDAAVLEVQDRGRGIEPEALPHLFDGFGHRQAPVHGRQGGLGIGLALVKALATAHGGDVEARSDGIGRGSCFSVRLPRIARAGAEHGADGDAGDGPAR